MDVFSYSSLRLEPHHNQARLGTATGFVIHSNITNSHYLVTNRHVVEGVNPQTRTILDSHGRVPDSVKICFFSQEEFIVTIESNVDNWLFHTEESYDLALLPLETFLTPEKVSGNNIKITKHSLEHLVSTDIAITPGMQIVVIGYPGGYSVNNTYPIWITGALATDYEQDWDSLPISLINASVFSGMSGSPVLLRHFGPYELASRPGNINLGASRTIKLLGIYSGRLIDHLPEYNSAGEAIEVGMVWKPRIIEEIIQQYKDSIE